jgi:hypothetical protein
VPLKVIAGSTKPIPVSNLLEYCIDHQKDGNKGFAEEFKVCETHEKIITYYNLRSFETSN